MSWVTILWSMNASACLTLAAIYFLVWCQRRKAWDNLLFTLSSSALAVYTGLELCMIRAETPAQFATALRWLHVPVWVLFLSLVPFVRRLARLLDPYASSFFVATGITPAMSVVVNSRMNVYSLRT
jgi:hypothetical protein